jgi:hypothetical protein
VSHLALLLRRLTNSITPLLEFTFLLINHFLPFRLVPEAVSNSVSLLTAVLLFAGYSTVVEIPSL